MALTDGTWKYIPAAKGPARNKQTNTELGNSKVNQLYNLDSDPSERTNLAEKHPDMVEKMHLLLQQERTKLK